MNRSRSAVAGKLRRLELLIGRLVPKRWTSAQVEQLKGLRLTNISASLIADELGTTRNAVLGKLHRMGMSTPVSVKTSNGLSLKRRPRRPPIWKPKSSPMALLIPNLPADKSENPVSIYELEPHHCRYPVGTETPAKWFCGDPVIEGKSYCPRHHHVAYRSSSRLDPQERARAHSWWDRQTMFTPSGQSRLAPSIELIPTDSGQPSRAG